MTKIVFLVMAGVTFVSGTAFACRPTPIDVDQKIKDMERVALAVLNTEKDEVETVSISDKQAYYVPDGRGCHKGIFVKGTYEVSYKKDLQGIPIFCVGAVKLTMTKPTRSRQVFDHTYTGKILGDIVCHN